MPDTFSLDSAADIHRPMTNLVIGSSSVIGDFVYHFTPGEVDYFVGWPERIRLTQFNNPALDEVVDPSILRIDFNVEFTLDEAGIPVGGVPFGVKFRASGKASYARYDYLVQLESSIFHPDAP